MMVSKSISGGSSKYILNALTGLRMMSKGKEDAAPTYIIKERPKNNIYDPYYEEGIFGSKPRTKSGGFSTVSLIPGVGSGEKHCEALQEVFACAGAPVSFELIMDPYSDEGFANMMLSIQRNGLAIKGNIEPRSKGTMSGLSLNMLTRKLLDLHISVFEFKTYKQLSKVMKVHNFFDMVLMRQNTEGEYSMLEHCPIDNVVENLRIVTRANSIRMAKYAFEYAKRKGRKKVTLVTNKFVIPKSEYLFIDSFYEVSQDFRDIKSEDINVSNFCRSVMKDPSGLDVILCNSLLGTIIASIFCGFLGSIELVPNKNLGPRAVLFEQASWRKFQEFSRVEQNPISLFLCGVGILEEIGAMSTANAIRDSIGETLEAGVWTTDLGGTANVDEFTTFLISCIKTKVRNIQCHYDKPPAMPTKPKEPTKPFSPEMMPGMSAPEPNYKMYPPNHSGSDSKNDTNN